MILNSPTISGSLTVTGNIIASGSITLSGSVASASYAATASFVALAQSASNAVAAATASFANAFTVAGTLTAQTLVVQTITSSVDFVTGSTRFGSIAANTHQFTGSIITSGSVGIGTTPTHSLTLVGGQTTPGSFSAGNYTFGIYSGSASTVLRETFAIGSDSSYVYMQSWSSRPLYINSQGNNIILGNNAADVKVLIGNPSGVSLNGMINNLSVSSTTYNLFDISRFSDNAFGPNFYLVKSRNASVGGNTIVANGDNLGNITWVGANGTGFTDAANIRAEVDGTPGASNDMPGRLVFLTTADGSGSTTERMRITSGGNVAIGTTSTNTNVKLKVKASSEGTDIGLSSSTLCIARIATDTQLNIGYYSTPDAFVISSTYGSDGAYKPLVLATSDTERMRISNTGTTTFAGPTMTTGTQGTYTLLVGEAGSAHLSLGHKASTGGYIQTWSSTNLYLNQQGNAVYAGAVRLDTLSDQRIKDNIQPISGSLNKILQLNGKKFHLKDEPENKIRYGFIAQDLEGILDEFVIQTDMTFTKGDLVVENVKSIENWASSWAALLVEAIKELKSQNDALQSRIETLESK